MNLRSRLSAVFAVALLAFAGLSAAQDAKTEKAATEFVEGKDYFLIDPPVPSRAGDKIEVVEVFGYSCPHCAHFAPLVTEWTKRQKSDVQFELVPAAFGGIWDAYAAVYFTAATMGVADKAHDEFFKALHEDKMPVRNLEDIAQFYADRTGVNKDEFLSTIESFPVNDKVADARQRGRAYGVEGTPTMVVNGKYRVMAGQGGFKRMLQVTDFLVEKERASLSAK